MEVWLNNVKSPRTASGGRLRQPTLLPPRVGGAFSVPVLVD